MKDIKWIVQNNLLSERDIELIGSACNAINVEYQPVDVLPMSSELPEFNVQPNNVYYGSTTFMYNLYNQIKPKGLFFDESTFSMQNYINKWGEHMLNSDATVLTVKKLLEIECDPNEDFFIRPDSDGKQFDGQVMEFRDIKGFIERHLLYDSNIDLDTKVLIGPVYNIDKEWRNYIVDGKVVTSSLYRHNFRLKKDANDIPESMIKFVEDRIAEYKPHDNFAIDIASTKDGTYYIIECGCLNSVGFYHADISKIVSAVTDYMLK